MAHIRRTLPGGRREVHAVLVGWVTATGRLAWGPGAAVPGGFSLGRHRTLLGSDDAAQGGLCACARLDVSVRDDRTGGHGKDRCELLGDGCHLAGVVAGSRHGPSVCAGPARWGAVFRERPTHCGPRWRGAARSLWPALPPVHH